MATTTSRLVLRKPASADLIDEQLDLNNNFDKIDPAVGMTVATAATRPASPYPGQRVIETDTSNAITRDSVAANWRHQSAPVNPDLGYLGLIASDMTSQRLVRNNGTTNLPLVSLGDTALSVPGEARYTATAVQSIPTGAAPGTVLVFDAAPTYQSPDVLANAAKSIFTIKTDGMWAISAGCRLVAFTGTGTQVDRQMAIRKNGSFVASVAKAHTSAACSMSTKVHIRLTLNDVIDVVAFHQRGAALNTEPSFKYNFVSFVWLRP